MVGRMSSSGAAGFEGWSRLHGGIRPSAPVRAWLRLVQRLAAGPFARVPPDVLSAAGVLSTMLAVLAAAAGGRWALLTAALVLLAGLFDGLDGAVALHTGRARPLGAVVDAMADRVGDLLLVVTLAVLGAPPAWCAAVAGLVFGHEYLRARAQAAGLSGVGAVTVAERPTRIIVVAVSALGAAALPGGTPGTGWSWAAVGAGGWLAVGVIGLVQLAIAVVREMPAQAGPTSAATIDADRATRGSPPPGCVDPPTR
jgi:archaetidylinositol phosphate synthase